MKKFWKRVFAYLLVCFSLFMICVPGVYASQPVETSISVALGGEFSAGAEGDISTMDDLLALAVSGYFGANGIALVNYNQSRESYVDMIVRYFKEYYTAQIDGSAARDFYDWFANSITETGFGIQRVAGAVSGVANLLIGEPLAQVLEPFKNWWNNKFNPQGTVETAQTVEIVRDMSVAAAVVPLADGSDFILTVRSDGNFVPNPTDPFFSYSIAPVGRISLAFGDSFDFYGSAVSTYEFNRVRFVLTLNSGSIYTFQVFVDNEISYGFNFSVNSSERFCLVGFDGGVGFCRIDSDSMVRIFKVFGPDSSSKFSSFSFPYSYFYSDSQQFDDSGISVSVMSVSSDGSLSYGPDISSADNIIQSTETLSVPIIAPSISGSSLSFSTSDMLAELVEKALQTVTASLSDASSNTLELPSNDSTLSPDISIEANIDWAEDTVVEVTPTPTITPGAIVTVIPTAVVTPWPVSDQQLAVIGSDGQIAIVGVVQTIKGWTQSLSDVYQMYVDLVSALFSFLPDELIVLLNWSLSALIFTGLFKRWWWSHH